MLLKKGSQLDRWSGVKLAAPLFPTVHHMDTMSINVPRAAAAEFPVWMNYEEVLEELDIPRSSMDRWRADGRGPRFTKLPNGALRIRRDRLEEWLEGLPA